MGYFKRKLDRGRAREAVRDLHAHHLADGTWVPWLDERPDPPVESAYLRFAIGERDPYSDRRQGIFHASYHLRQALAEDDAVRAAIDDELAWFGDHLAVPDIDRDGAIFFFKAGATECTRRIWNLAHLLRSQGLTVEMQVVENPGRIVYQDEDQVAAVPWGFQTDL